MYLFKNKNTKYFKSPSTVHHENRDFSENKKVLQYKNPLKTILRILFFYAFRSNNTPTVSHQKTWKYLQNIIFSVNAFENHYPDISQVLRKSSYGSFSGVVCVLWRVTVEYKEAGTEFAKARHPQKSRKRSVWRVVRALC